MTTIREKALPLFSKARVALIDAKGGLRRYTVYRRTRTPSDGRGGVGATWTVVDTPLPLGERPRVRAADQKDIVSSGGRIKVGDFVLSHITPQSADGSVGTSPSFFGQQPTSPGQTVCFVLAPVDPNNDEMPAYSAGPPPSGGGEFTCSFVDASANFEIRAVLTPLSGRQV